jgi:hypothetical protein
MEKSKNSIHIDQSKITVFAVVGFFVILSLFILFLYQRVNNLEALSTQSLALETVSTNRVLDTARLNSTVINDGQQTQNTGSNNQITTKEVFAPNCDGWLSSNFKDANGYSVTKIVCSDGRTSNYYPLAGSMVDPYSICCLIDPCAICTEYPAVNDPNADPNRIPLKTYYEHMCNNVCNARVQDSSRNTCSAETTTRGVLQWVCKGCDGAYRKLHSCLR